MDVLERIDQQVKQNPVIIYMKGTPQMPMCGFSSRASQALAACGEHLQRFGGHAGAAGLTVDASRVSIGTAVRAHVTLELYQKGELQRMTQTAAEQQNA